jgi:4-amino-4-deoxy-L-arabinose transferase-like glycosyltransferase
VYLFTANGSVIADDGDALYAHIAQEMLARHDWVTPYANGVRVLDKPPLLYWLTAATYSLLGVSEFAARVPGALTVVGAGWFLYLLGKMGADDRAGFAAGLAGTFCIGTFLFTRQVNTDGLLVFFLTVSLYAFMTWYLDEHGNLWSALLFYASLAGAVLAKGLVGLILPGASVLLFFVRVGGWEKLKRAHVLLGSLLFLGLAAPWHILAALRNPGFLWWYFVNEQFLRFISHREPLDYTSLSRGVFVSSILVWLFPWTAFIPALFHVGAFRRKADPAAHAIVWLALIWSGVVLTFFTLSSGRLERYAQPLFPSLALLVGIALCGQSSENSPAELRRERSIARSFTLLVVVGIAAAVGLGAGLMWFTHRDATAALGFAGARVRGRANTWLLDPLFDVPAAIVGRLAPLAVATAAVLVLGPAAAWWLNRNRQRMRAVIALSGMTMAVCVVISRSMAICGPVISSADVAAELVQLYRPHDHFIVMGNFETANSINFYARIPIQIFQGRADLIASGLGYPDAPRVILSRADLEATWTAPEHAFLLVPDGEVPNVPVAPLYTVMRSAGRTLFSNRPVQAWTAGAATHDKARDPG